MDKWLVNIDVNNSKKDNNVEEIASLEDKNRFKNKSCIVDNAGNPHIAQGSGGNNSSTTSLNSSSVIVENGIECVKATENVLTKSLPSDKIQANNCFVKFKLGKKGRFLVRCSVFCNNKDVALLHTSQPGHLPKICTEEGTIPRSDVMDKHLSSAIHLECIRADNFKALSVAEKMKVMRSIDKLISKQNLALSNKIGSYMITAYNDAKRGTLSAWSWPSREVAHILGNRLELDVTKPSQLYEIKNAELQYINPMSHKDFLQCIVEVDIPRVQELLKNALAVSLRLDGSVDRKLLDNIHVMAKVITEVGDSLLLFLSFQEQTERGAEGYYKAVQDAVKNLMDWESLLEL